MTNTSQSHVEIDAMGKPCPMPLLMLKRQLKHALPAQRFLLKSSDPHSEIDILRYCEIHHIQCLFKKISEQEYHYFIES